jgi:hypothetical protein
MFGKHWKPAQGTVVDRRTTYTTNDGYVSNHEFVVDVRTPEGETFRARVGEPRIATHFRAPLVGEAVGVEYDPKSHDVRFDKDDSRTRLEPHRRSQASDFDAVLSQPPGTPVGPSAPLRNADPMVQGFLDRAQAAQQAHNPDPNSPEAVAIREAMARAMGSTGYPGYPPTGNDGSNQPPR